MTMGQFHLTPTLNYKIVTMNLVTAFFDTQTQNGHRAAKKNTFCEDLNKFKTPPPLTSH